MDNIYNKMYSVFEKRPDGRYVTKETREIQDHQNIERYYAVSGCYGLRRIKI